MILFSSYRLLHDSMSVTAVATYAADDYHYQQHQFLKTLNLHVLHDIRSVAADDIAAVYDDQH